MIQDILLLTVQTGLLNLKMDSEEIDSYVYIKLSCIHEISDCTIKINPTFYNHKRYKETIK